ncbi:biotin--[acetyl-CoA-carboxylase] ligase [Rhodobacteraceae bacterium WD3A24]|nr:biotin--[acetyl-CoA-carboxylase] ligase [Rhodobacteraceae bacterium WD3A24]
MSAETRWPAGVGRHVLAEVDSTNAEAARRADSIDLPAWFLGLRQTGGRGRRGRPWADPEGNFAATLLMAPEGPAEQAALRSFVAALALFDAFAAVTGRPGAFALKWPNDVLVNGGKVAGILLEGIRDRLAIGVGVNLLNAPPADPDAAAPPTSLLSATGTRVTPEELLDALAPAFARWEAVFVAEGFAPVRAAWLDRAARLGRTITARTVRETHEGLFETVDAHGALVLRTARGRVAISAAEVYF